MQQQRVCEARPSLLHLPWRENSVPGLSHSVVSLTEPDGKLIARPFPGHKHIRRVFVLADIMVITRDDHKYCWPLARQHVTPTYAVALTEP